MMQLPFQWTRDSLSAEERRLRLAADSRAQALADVLEALAIRFAREKVDALRRLDPDYFQRLDSTAWRQFWQGVEIKLAAPPSNAQISLLPSIEELEKTLRIRDEEIDQLRNELTQLRAEDGDVRSDLTVIQAVIAQPELDFALPDKPPASLAGWFTNWPREGIALSLLAQTGWSLRHAIAQSMALHLGITPTAGSLKRHFAHLYKNGLWQTQTVTVGQMSVALVQLTDKGRTVAQVLGIPAVESEWEQLHRAHGGDTQLSHTALVCMFAHQARQRGYMTTICPDTSGSSVPDVLLRQGDEAVYVEVEAESGDAERRMRKWRNLADLQGFVALCALTPESARRLILEARGASLHGRATDIDSLFRQPHLWAIEW